MSLKRNIASLQLLQLSSFGIPLIVQPWLARVLGLEGYGHYNFIIAVMSYFVLLADFGFNWSATRELAIHRDNQLKRSAIVCTTYAAKALLAVAGFIGLLTVVSVVDSLRPELSLLLMAYASVVGAVFAPVWYFQGMEAPHVTSFVDIGARLLAVPLILLAVRLPTDLFVAVTLTATTQLLIGVVGIGLLIKNGGIIWAMPALKDIAIRIRVGFPLFLSMSAVSLYTVSNSIILGLIAKHEQLAFFSAAQKLVSAACSVFVPINQALYPRISNSFHSKFSDGLRIVKLTLYVELAIGLSLTVLIFVFAERLSVGIFGAAYLPAARILRSLSVLPVLLACIGVFANLIMLPLGYDSKHVRMVAGAAAINLIAIVPLVHLYGGNGAAIAICAAEFFVFVYSAHCVISVIRAQRLTSRESIKI